MPARFLLNLTSSSPVKPNELLSPIVICDIARALVTFFVFAISLDSIFLVLYSIAKFRSFNDLIFKPFIEIFEPFVFIIDKVMSLPLIAFSISLGISVLPSSRYTESLLTCAADFKAFSTLIQSNSSFLPKTYYFGDSGIFVIGLAGNAGDVDGSR